MAGEVITSNQILCFPLYIWARMAHNEGGGCRQADPLEKTFSSIVGR